MENASKALLMAGGILISLLIISSLILMFNNLTIYQQTNKAAVQDAETVEFNNQYATYDRNDVRGSDLISLINKVVDYNTRKSTDGFEEMKIDIIGIKTQNLQYDINKNFLIKSSYNESNLKTELLDKVKPLETKYGESYIAKLSSNIQNIIVDSKDKLAVSDAKKKLQQILPNNIDSYIGGMEQIQKDTQTYYEYSQLKRSYFNCIDRAYNTNTGKIIYMKFEYKKTGV